MTPPIRFDDGAGYERFMGAWSQLAGREFLEWLGMAPARRWLDVGCGNGAFTELLVERSAPRAVAGVDPSAAQIAFARARPALAEADIRLGDAMALPFDDGAFDVSVMPLVIFFVPDPALAVAEMARVTAPGGTVAAYSWDMEGRGFPYASLHAGLTDLGVKVPPPPHPEAARFDVLEQLWGAAGLTSIDTRVITVSRTFASFDEYWDIIKFGPSTSASFAQLHDDGVRELQQRMRRVLPIASDGTITYEARAHAVAGRVG